MYFFFRWQLPHLPCWCEQTSRVKPLNNCWGSFYPRLWDLEAVGGESRGGWPQTSVCQASLCHTCISHRVIFKACRGQHVIRLRPKKKQNKRKKTADILHSWAHSTKYNNFLEFFDPRRRSQGTSCCPRSTSCSCGSISLPRCHGHWKTLYSCLLGMLAGSAWVIVEWRDLAEVPVRLCWHQSLIVLQCV